MSSLNDTDFSNDTDLSENNENENFREGEKMCEIMRRYDGYSM
jgi:hypothetical protein